MFVTKQMYLKSNPNLDLIVWEKEKKKKKEKRRDFEIKIRKKWILRVEIFPL